MKKALILLLALVFLSGCGNKKEPATSATESGLTLTEAAETVSDTPPEQEETEFLIDLFWAERVAQLTVDSITTITGHGCAVSGIIDSGEFTVGDTVIIIYDYQPLAQTTVLNIVVERKEVQSAKEGDDAEILLEGIERSLLSEGYTIAKYSFPSKDSSPEVDSAEETVYTKAEINEFFNQLDRYARTGDIRLLNHLNFELEENYAGMEALLTDDTARELWCTAFAPTEWYLPELDDDIYFESEIIRLNVKSPVWLYLNNFYIPVSGCAPMSQEPEAIKSYFEAYKDIIPYSYYELKAELIEGKLKVEGEWFANRYVAVVGSDDAFASALKNPLQPFTKLINTLEYTLELPEMTEEETLLTEYYKLVADNRFFDAIELLEGTRLEIKSNVISELAALNDEQRALLQSEIDKLPKGEFYQYSQIGGSGKLVLKGLLVSYNVDYRGSYEVFGIKGPLITKSVTGPCYSTPYGKPSVDHFPAIYNIMWNMEQQLIEE